MINFLLLNKMEDKLIFYSNSKDNEIGKNKNEFINNSDEYLELNNIF